MKKKKLFKLLIIVVILGLLFIPLHKLAASHVNKHSDVEGHSLNCISCHFQME